MRRRIVGLVMIVLAGAGCSGPATVTLSQRSGATPGTSALPEPPPASSGSPTMPTTTVGAISAPGSAGAHTTTSVTRPTTRAPAITTTTRPGAASSVIVPITEMDSGRTIQLHLGQSIELTLAGSGVQWGGVTEAPTGLLAGDPAPAPPPHGVLLLWTAVRPGSVRLSATGTAWCPGATPCPLWARLFEVTVVLS